MSTSSLGQKTPVDHGVQIRFINNLGEKGGAQPGPQPKARPQPHSKYGVAVRVQGIAGQPYVVLKDGQKGDSYGVQLKTQYHSGHGSLPRRRDRGEAGSHGAHLGAGEGGGQGGALRRAQSHGSLLDRDGEGELGKEDFQLSRPPGDGKSGSYGNLDGGIGLRGERDRDRERGLAWGNREGDPNERNAWGGSYSNVGPNGSEGSGPFHPEQPQQPLRKTPVNRLVSQFNSRGQHRGHPHAEVDPTAASPALSLNPYTAPPASKHNHSTRTSLDSSRRNVPAERRVVPNAHGPNGGTSSEEEEEEEEEVELMQMIYNVLRQGAAESDVAIRHKVKIIFQKIQHLQRSKERLQEVSAREKRELERKMAELQATLQAERRNSAGSSDPNLKAELEGCLDENLQLRETLDRKKKELNDTQSDLTQLRMERESAEARVRDMEDKLAEFQDELRRETGNKTDLMSCQTQLMEASQLRQRLEETLRQRERELTALKGALKEEVASHDKELESLREQYSKDMEKLRGSMEQVSQSHAGIEAERLRVNASVRTLQQQLEDCRDESGHWMEQFHSTRDELRTTKQELLQTRLEKEDLEEELKEQQERVSTMKRQIPDPSHTHTLSQEIQRYSADLQKTKQELDTQRAEYDKKVMEVIGMKKTHQSQEAELQYEINRLKDQLQRTKEDFARAQDKKNQLPDPAVLSEMEQNLRESQSEASQLKDKLSVAAAELEATKTRLSRAQTDVQSLQSSQEEREEANRRLKEKLSRLEAQLQSQATESSEAELALHAEVRALRGELDEAKRKASTLSQEQRELSQRLEDTEKDREALRAAVSQLEGSKGQQERVLEKLSKEHESLTASSREEAQALRAQLEEQRERARREMQEAQRHGSSAQSELDRSHMNARRLEEEMSRLKKELLLACEERDNHQLDKELLTNRLRHLEQELEASKSSVNEKTRESRLLEDKLKRLELELEEEKSSAEMMTDRVGRSRDQIDQLRSELMLERSSKQDLELDKSALERQLKELRSRVADMEGQSRSSAGVSQLESKVQDLEERLRNEEREKSSVVASQRRLERKLKELNMTVDEERQTHTEQKDQLVLRVKALKRQVDEGETELERIETQRRKALRDLEEQQELKDALQSRVTALEAELKRKTGAAVRPVLDSSALSSDDDDSLYDPSSITSFLTESNLQTSSC